MEQLGRYIYKCGLIIIDIRCIAGFDDKTVLMKGFGYGPILQPENIYKIKEVWIKYNNEKIPFNK